MTMHERELRAYYSLLEVPASASLAEVRDAYRLLSRVWHPDRFAGNPDLLAKANARQQELNAAYRRLLDAYASGAAPLAATDGAAETSSSTEAARAAAPAPASAHGTSRPRKDHLARLWSRRPAETAIAAGLLVLSLLLVAVWLARRSAPLKTLAGDVLPATTIAVGGTHACAGMAAGIACWGHNDYGQRGDSSPGVLKRAATLVLPDSVAAIAAGMSHTCVLAHDGVQCWGGNYTGQLGNRSLHDRVSPAGIAVAEPFVMLSTLTYHTCGLSRGGSAYCWGNDTDGQLGVARPVASCRWGEQRSFCSDRPERVGYAGEWRAIAAGGSHTCAIDIAGRVHCWGSNLSGQLGAPAREQCRGPGGAQPCRRTPALAALKVPVKAIAAGAAHSCALGWDGRAYCWGANQHGQAGAATAGRVAVPTALDAAPPFTAIAAGAFHTCGLTAAGALYCWGRDQDRELRGRARERCERQPCSRSPVRLFRSGVAEVAAGFGRTCIRRARGDVLCWGRGPARVMVAPRAALHAPAPLHGLRLFLAQLRWYAASFERLLYHHLD